MRIFLAGLAGAVAMFIWSAIAHMPQVLGQVGISEIQNEETVLFAMQSAIGEKDGLYLFPEYGSAEDASTQYEAKLKTFPSGILVYHPPGAEAVSARLFVVEFLSQVVESLLLAFILAATALTAFLSRLSIAGAAGGCAVTGTNVSYWNWYGFPHDYTLAYMAMDFVGYLVAGIVIILILQRGSARRR
jgi:hypothetical protein